MKIYKKFNFTLRVYFILFLLFCSHYHYAVTVGPNNGGTFANVACCSGVAWTAPGNAQTSNNVWASVFLDYPPAQNSQYLQATNFGFAIPAGATIDGIIVEIELHVFSIFNADIYDNSVKIVNGGIVTGTEHAAAGSWSLGSDVIRTYGSCTDLWGETWTPADINASNFGVAISANSAGSIGGNTAFIDRIRISVCYTDGALPIELLRFNATADNTAAYLDWSTASETNNDYFTVEKSANGLDFEAIGTVDGAGNSSTVHSYSFTDEFSTLQLSNFPLVYYRLKQIDYDGKYQYSNVISVDLTGDENNLLTVFPNAASDKINLEVFSVEAGIANVEIIDAIGRVLVFNTHPINSGKNYIPVSIINLSKGLYFIRTTGRVQTWSKFIKE